MHASHCVTQNTKKFNLKSWDLIKLIMFTIIDIKWNCLFFKTECMTRKNSMTTRIVWCHCFNLRQGISNFTYHCFCISNVNINPVQQANHSLELCEHSLTCRLPVRDTTSCWNFTDWERFHRASQKRNSQWLASCLLATYKATVRFKSTLK